MLGRACSIDSLRPFAKYKFEKNQKNTAYNDICQKTIFRFILSGWMGKVFSKLRLETAKRTDERIRTMNEIISAMRVIKMYTWEKPFAKLISKCRRYLMKTLRRCYTFSDFHFFFIFRKEINVIKRTNHFRALNMSLFFTSSKLIIFLTFLVFIFTGNHLTAEKVYNSFHYFFFSIFRFLIYQIF